MVASRQCPSLALRLHIKGDINPEVTIPGAVCTSEGAGRIKTKIEAPKMYGPPVFPRELERRIFELAVKDNPRSTLPVMLVAARTHHWIAAMLYSVSNQLGKTYPPIRGSSPIVQYYGAHVKHLIIGGDKSFDGIRRYISACPNLVDLAIWSDCRMEKFIPIFNDLKLERLSSNLSSLSLSDFQSPAFVNITHLDITRCGPKWCDHQGLPALPRLTHLAINEMVEDDTLRQLLQQCKRLQILLAVDRGSWYGWDCEWDARRDIIMDPRFIMMNIVRYVIEDWMDGARGGEDMWEWAETISLAKQRESYRDGGKLWSTWIHARDWRNELKKACE